MAKNKILIFDLDGTLLANDKQLTSTTIEYIKAIKKNHIIGVATGRPVYMIKKQIKQLKPDMPIISMNGGMISDQYGSPISYKSIEKAEADHIIKLCQESRINFLAYTERKMYFLDHGKSKRINWTRELIDSYDEPEKWDFLPIKDINKFGEKIIKFLILADEAEKSNLEKLKNYMNQEDIKSYMISSFDGVHDIMHKDVSKGKALQEIFTLKNLDSKNAIVFGDAQNDIPMFDKVPISVAMINGFSETKKAATNISSKTNDEDGVIEWLKENL